MTIAALLEHVGVNVPRFVTIDGQIVFDASLAPTTQASPLPLTPHRFHGGEDPQLEVTSYANAWWNLDPAARAADERAMKTYFPGFAQIGAESQYAFGGEIDTGRGRFKILAIPQVDRSLPAIVPLMRNMGRPHGKRIERPPHLYTSGNLCIASTSDWDPDEHSTATAVAWAAHWLAAFTEWRITGRWPAEGYGEAA